MFRAYLLFSGLSVESALQKQARLLLDKET